MKTIIFIVTMMMSQIVLGQIANKKGVWEHQEGNQIFRVIFDVFDGLNQPYFSGHYEKVEVDNSGNETIIYTSQVNLCDICPILPAMQFGSSGTLGYQSGTISDIVDFDNKVSGSFHLREIETCSTCPREIRMKLSSFHLNNEEYFNLPVDIVLTKQD